jgi:oxygen-independent coproporphyrinogen III oxidase
MEQTIVFDSDLIKRYDKSGPRYTSYPTAVQFHEGFTEETYREYALKSNQNNSPLSLYFHIPFCDTVCYYCACNKVVTKDRNLSPPYLMHLFREIELQSVLFDKNRPVTQLHWGGGTPTFLNNNQINELMNKTREHFHLLDDDSGEYSIEIDPREANAETIAILRKNGFNRMSLGVQDFEPQVQKAVNRIQSEAETFLAMNAARNEGFKSISIDLIYGLPFQNATSFLRTLEKIISVSPDRISIFNYAHLPTLFKPQRRINEQDLPSPSEKLNILQQAIQALTFSGYVYIGMDHFAKPNDELAIAQRSRTLYRNFQGYATHADCDLIGMGSTSIGKIGNSYSQNLKLLPEYYAAIDANKLAVFRGVALTNDDVLRRDVITQLICHFYLSIPDIETKYNINFINYFANAWEGLAQFQSDGLLKYNEQSIEILPVGKLMIRNVCMLFDHYLQQSTTQRFSKVL